MEADQRLSALLRGETRVASVSPYGELAIIEDARSGGLLSSGLLDMLAVQHTAARALPTRRLSSESLHGARVVLNVDASSLVERQRKDIEDFASGGGKVVNPPPVGASPKSPRER